MLSDDEKRKVYDQFGEEGVKHGAGGAGGPGAGAGGSYTMDVDPRELFKQFFGGADPFAAGGGGGGAGSFFSQFQTGAGGGSNPFGGGGGAGTQQPAPPAKLHTVRVKAGPGGLGLKLSRSNEVLELTRGGAAEAAGLRVGDVVYEVDGTTLAGGARAADALKSARTSHMLKVRTDDYDMLIPHQDNPLPCALQTRSRARARRTCSRSGRMIMICSPPHQDNPTFLETTADTAHSAHRQHCGHTAPSPKGRETILRTRRPHSIGLCSPLSKGEPQFRFGFRSPVLKVPCAPQ